MQLRLATWMSYEPSCVVYGATRSEQKKSRATLESSRRCSEGRPSRKSPKTISWLAAGRLMSPNFGLKNFECLIYNWSTVVNGGRLVVSSALRPSIGKGSLFKSLGISNRAKANRLAVLKLSVCRLVLCRPISPGIGRLCYCLSDCARRDRVRRPRPAHAVLSCYSEPASHRRTLPDVYECHRLGRHRWGRLW